MLFYIPLLLTQDVGDTDVGAMTMVAAPDDDVVLTSGCGMIVEVGPYVGIDVGVTAGRPTTETMEPRAAGGGGVVEPRGLRNKAEKGLL